MVTGARTSRRDRTAIASSIAVHCCALVALATLGRLALVPDPPDERTVIASLIHIERRIVVEKPRPQPIPSAGPATPRLAPPRMVVLRAASSTQHAAIVKAEHRYVAVATHRTASTGLPVVTAERTAATVAVAPVAHASAAPDSPAVTTVAETHDDGIGNFGENYPAKVDPHARGGLFAGVPDSVLMRVEVDENGHVTALVFVRAPADAALKDELRSRILAMHFIPAACNGLRCSDTIELHN